MKHGDHRHRYRWLLPYTFVKGNTHPAILWSANVLKNKSTQIALFHYFYKAITNLFCMYKITKLLLPLTCGLLFNFASYAQYVITRIDINPSTGQSMPIEMKVID